MTFSFTPRKDKRILEIKKTLNDHDRVRKIGTGMTNDGAKAAVEVANRPLVNELEELQIKRKFSHANWQLGVNIISIATALFIAFYIPYHSSVQKQEENIQAVYEVLIANSDISISNDNELILAKRTGVFNGLPQRLIEYEIDKDTLRLIQNRFGIMQYQFFLYYLNHTNLYNKVINRLHDRFTSSGSLALSTLDYDGTYREAIASLSTENKTAKFVYLRDTECLMYFFQKAFGEHLMIGDREGKITCFPESLERLFNFGYIPVDTPKWLLPQLREMLNTREAGLGDRLISEVR